MKFHGDRIAIGQAIHKSAARASAVEHETVGRDIHIARRGWRAHSHHFDRSANHKRFAFCQSERYFALSRRKIGAGKKMAIVEHHTIVGAQSHQIHTIDCHGRASGIGYRTGKHRASDDGILLMGIEHKLREIGIGVRLKNFALHHTGADRDSHHRLASRSGARSVEKVAVHAQEIPFARF